MLILHICVLYLTLNYPFCANYLCFIINLTLLYQFLVFICYGKTELMSLLAMSEHPSVWVFVVRGIIFVNDCTKSTEQFDKQIALDVSKVVLHV